VENVKFLASFIYQKSLTFKWFDSSFLTNFHELQKNKNEREK